MTLSHVTGINGWADRIPVVFRLRQNVIDLSDRGYRHAQFIEQVSHKDSGSAFDQNWIRVFACEDRSPFGDGW